MNDTDQSISTMRWYGGAIALVSGSYSLYLSWTVPEMTTTMWAMVALGVIVIVHGGVLLTPLSASITPVSGPLMIVYAIGMLGIQWWMDMDESEMMMDEAMRADAGMIALAILMLFSGILMTHRRRMGSQ